MDAFHWAGNGCCTAERKGIRNLSLWAAAWLDVIFSGLGTRGFHRLDVKHQPLMLHSLFWCFLAEEASKFCCLLVEAKYEKKPVDPRNGEMQGWDSIGDTRKDPMIEKGWPDKPLSMWKPSWERNIHEGLWARGIHEGSRRRWLGNLEKQRE